MGRKAPTYFRHNWFSANYRILFFTRYGFLGFPFTWERSRNGVVVLKERLDRGLANDKWLSMFNNYRLYHIDSATSDHSALLLKSVQQHITFQHTFRVNNVWGEKDECRNLVHSCWSVNGTLPIESRLQSLASSLNTWGRQSADYFAKQISDCKKKI